MFRTCYDPAFNPTYSPFTAACNQILRDPTNGQIGAVDVTYSNSSSVEDERRRPAVRLGHRAGGRQSPLELLDELSRQHEDEAEPDHGVERVEGHVGAGRPVGLEFGRVRLPDVHDVELREERMEPRPALAAPADDQAVGVRVNPNTTTIDTPSYDAFDLSGGLGIGDTWQLRYGIDNLLDEQPVFTNATRYTRGTTTLGGFYDVLGRRAYVGMSASFESARRHRRQVARARRHDRALRLPAAPLRLKQNPSAEGLWAASFEIGDCLYNDVVEARVALHVGGPVAFDGFLESRPGAVEEARAIDIGLVVDAS